MAKVYALNKKDNKIEYTADSLFLLKDIIQFEHKDENDFIFVGDLGMKFISRIVYVDGECVYNNKDYWTKSAPNIIEDFDEHKALDFMGLPVDKLRFQNEMYSNQNKIAAIDGLAGEIEYNIEIGNEFISLFREECVKTDFKTITPLQIAQKLSSVIGLVQTGSFREAKQVLQTIENDDFLTPERVSKYIAMMESADAIEYATDEDFFYTAQENT